MWTCIALGDLVQWAYTSLSELGDINEFRQPEGLDDLVTKARSTGMVLSNILLSNLHDASPSPIIPTAASQHLLMNVLFPDPWRPNEENS